MITLLAGLALAEPVVRPALVAPTQVKAGEPFLVEVRYDIAPGWHIYWENPGESGYATEVLLHLPEGWTASPTHFQGPSRFELPGGIVNYGYEQEATLFLAVLPPEDARGRLPIVAETRWLQCTADTCQPGEARLRTSVKAGRQTRPEPELSAFDVRFPMPFESLPGATLKNSGATAEIWIPDATRATLFPRRDLESGLRGVELRAESGGQRLVLTLDPAALGPTPSGVIELGASATTRYLSFELPPPESP